MSLLILFLVIILLRTNLQRDTRRSDAYKIFIAVSMILFMLSLLANAPLTLLALFGVIYYLLKKRQKDKKEDEKAQQYGWSAKEWNVQQASQQQAHMNQSQRQGSYQQASQSYGYSTPNPEKITRKARREQKKMDAAMGYTTLPKSVSKRKKIVEKFNDRFTLYLTPEQITSIVNSSYMSQIWRMEVEAMSRKYETVYEWFTGDTSWLRVYMYVFHVQEISSDIMQQERICMYAFEEIFRYADSLGNVPVSVRIDRINHKYLTNFDDVSYMIAYRFLESRGLHHDMESQDLVQNESEIDSLLEKYRTSPGQGPGMPSA